LTLKINFLAIKHSLNSNKPWKILNESFNIQFEFFSLNWIFLANKVFINHKYTVEFFNLV
jgi:hypothetical protein